MPSVSKKQHNFMAAIAHSPAFAKKVGVPQSVGKEFNEADKGKKFRSGGMAKKEMHSEKSEMKMDINQDKKLIKKAFGMHDKQLHENKKTNLTKLKGGGMAKETMGPRTMAMDVEKGSNKLTKFGQSAVQKRGMTKGTNLGDSGPTAPITKGMKAGGMCMGGKAKKMSAGGTASKRADGMAMKGKTKGKFC
jgi:hypothetical protein